MRIYWIDFLRIIAAVSIIAIHVSSPYFSSLAPSSSSWWLSNIIMSISKSMGPAMFVMISGYILMRREFEYATFYQVRAKRLLIPLLFWSLFYAIFVLLFIENSFKDFLWRISAGLVLSGRTYFHLWYLTMFFCLMLIAPIINKWIFGVRPSGSDLKIILLLASIFFGISSLSHLKEAFGSEEISWYKSFGIYAIYFILGHLIGNHINTVKISPRTFGLIYLLVITIAITINYVLAGQDIRGDNTVISDETIIGFIATCSIFSLATILKPGEKNQELLHKCALNSFGIYLIHPFVLFFAFQLISLVTKNEIATLLYAISLTVFASYMFTAILRKTYFGRLIT